MTTDNSELIERLLAGCPTYVENMSNNRRGAIAGDIDAATAIMLEAATALSARSNGWREGVEAAAKLCEQWRDENRLAAAKARKREGVLGDTGMADQLEGAMTECNALSAAIRALTPPETTP